MGICFYFSLQIQFEGLAIYGYIYFSNLFLYPESGKCKSTGNKHCLIFFLNITQLDVLHIGLILEC